MTQNTFIERVKRHGAAFVTALTGFCALFLLGLYLMGPTNGHLNKIFLPAQMWGIPQKMVDHGMEPLYLLPGETGWDGQFYHSVANDPLALADTADHIDSPAYRYQRIGLPLLAFLASKITGQDWVSPLTYYLTNLLLILAAVYFSACFFKKKGMPPFLILFWSLGAGTQLTLLNGLPDSAGDALVILAFLSLIHKKTAPYLLAITFAALSREIYVFVPCFVALAVLLLALQKEGMKGCFQRKIIVPLLLKMSLQTLPVLAVAGWQLFVRYRFGVFASSEAAGILGLPFVSLFDHMISGFIGNHWLVGHGFSARYEGIGILLFLALISLSLYVMVRLLKSKDSASLAFALSFSAIALSYYCFGKTVMMHHTGYFKAANIFMFVLPMSFILQSRPLGKHITAFLLLTLAFFTIGLWGRVAAAPYFGAYQVPERPILNATKEPACLRSPQTEVKLLGIESYAPRYSFQRTSQTLVLHVQLTNKGKEKLSPFTGKGDTALGARWVSKDSDYTYDGPLTHIPSLSANQKIQTSVILPTPKRKGGYMLTISPVQKECGWFYEQNKENGYAFSYDIR